jgi:hypothetical protein
MVTVRFLNRFEVKPGKETNVERAPKKTLGSIKEEMGTIAWFSFRLSPSTLAAFS